MTFGEYIKTRRKKLGLTQDEIGDYSQSYVASIERGQKNPVKYETIATIASALQLHNKHTIDWLWCYSLLDRDPYQVFCSSPSAQGAPHIRPGASEIAVRQALGMPSLILEGNRQIRWDYDQQGVHVFFENGNVSKVEFI